MVFVYAIIRIMSTMRKFIFVTLLALYSISNSYSGEFANFEIIGFSGDMRFISFAEYGLTEDTKPFANLFIVNLRQNYFVNNGVFQNTYDVQTELEEDGSGALYSVLLQASTVLKQYMINPLNRGKLIYVLLDGEVPPETLSFTDYSTNTDYTVRMDQTARMNNNNNSEARFSIQLSIGYQKNKYDFVVGNPNYYRPLVKNYILRSIYASLDNRSLVFVVEKRSQSLKKNNDANIHYMIETISWR